MAKLLNLTDGARTIVYTTIVAQLKGDPTLSAVSPAIAWMTYLGEGRRQLPFAAGSYPAIELMPFGHDATPEAQVLQNSPLGIRALVTTAGLDVRDLLNLWGAFERALFPGDGSRALNNTIRALLAANAPPASLQTINLSQPVYKPGPNAAGSEFLTCEGYITALMTVPK